MGIYLIIRRNDCITNLKLTVLQSARMYNVSVVDLNIGHLKVSHTVDHNVAGIVFLTTCLSVKARAIQNDAKEGIVRDCRS